MSLFIVLDFVADANSVHFRLHMKVPPVEKPVAMTALGNVYFQPAREPLGQTNSALVSCCLRRCGRPKRTRTSQMEAFCKYKILGRWEDAALSTDVWISFSCFSFSQHVMMS